MLIGQACGILVLVSSVVLALSHHLQLSILPAGIKGFILLAILFLGGGWFLASRLQIPWLAELLFAAFFPIAQLFSLLNIPKLKELPLIGLGGLAMGASNYDLAVACYGAVVLSEKFLEQFSGNRHEYAVALACAGKSEQAVTFVEDHLAYSRMLFSQFSNENTSAYLANSAYTAATVQELVGSSERAHTLRLGLYEGMECWPLRSEARLIGLLCAGEAFVAEGRFEEAIIPLQRFVENAGECRQVSISSILMESARRNLAISLAHTGDKKSSAIYAIGARKYLQREFSSFSRLNQALMDAELCCISGDRDGAKQILELATRNIPAVPGGLTEKRLENKRSELGLPMKTNSLLVSDNVSASDRSELKQTCEHSPEEAFPTNASVLGRTGRISSMITWLAGGVLVTLSTQAHAYWWLLGLGLIILFMGLAHRRRANIASARKAIELGKRQEVRARIIGDGVEIRLNDKASWHKFYGSEMLMKQCDALAKGSSFSAAVYSNDDGKLKAIEIFGYYSSLVRTSIIP